MKDTFEPPHSKTPSPDPCTVKRWPHFSTPLSMFLAVMIPITTLMLALSLLGGMPRAIRGTAAIVVVISIYAFWRGYLHRLEIDNQCVRYRTLTRSIEIPWSAIRQIGRYIPPDRNPTTQYVYITRNYHHPKNRFTLDEETVQLQDRPGLLDSLRTAWAHSRHTESPNQHDQPPFG